MELLEAIKTRRSVREFTGPRIPDEHIGMILDVGRYAPSPENRARARFLDLELEDIEHESFKFTEKVSQAPVDNRKGRVYLMMEQGFYGRFLQAVRRKLGNISHVNVDKAALEAVKAWVEGVEAT